jgi:hypothetical protein
MTDDLEQRLRALRPLSMPPAVRVRIATAVRASSPRPRAALAWVSALAAALAVTLLAVVQPASRPPDDANADRTPSYGLLMRQVGAPAELLETIDRGRRPIPLFATFDREPSERNRP